ncbi:MAG: protein kinase [Acidobacteriota bacterium]
MAPGTSRRSFARRDGGSDGTDARRPDSGRSARTFGGATAATLAAGDELGPYRIVEPLGQGGMGEVYRGVDTRLGREIAIKVLPNRLAHDRQALLRFEREAKAVAALSHPNILTLYDIGTHERIPYAITELLEGETLRDRLRSRRRRSWWEVVDIGLAIARGLSAAHKKGIVHRDIKPANIFITQDGQVKILDFGVARVNTRIDLPAEDDAATGPISGETGAVVGTLAYMAPEQLNGGRADRRSDIFALGCVLYEMLVGHHPFARDTLVDTVMAVAKEPPPPLRDSGVGYPPALERLITRCLAKEPDARYDDTGALVVALSHLTGTGKMQPSWIGPAPASLPPRRRLRRRSLAIVLALALAVAAVGLQLRTRFSSVAVTGGDAAQITAARDARDLIAVLDFRPAPARDDDGAVVAPVTDPRLRTFLTVQLRRDLLARGMPTAASRPIAWPNARDADALARARQHARDLLGADWIIDGRYALRPPADRAAADDAPTAETRANDAPAGDSLTTVPPGPELHLEIHLLRTLDGETVTVTTRGPAAAPGAVIAQTADSLRRQLRLPESPAVDRASALDRASLEAQLDHSAGVDALVRGRLSDARDHLERAVEHAPEVAEIHEALAQLWQQLGRPGDAARHAEQARALRASDGGHASGDTAAGLRARARDAQLREAWDQAADLWRQVWVMMPDRLSDGLAYADALSRSQRGADARGVLEALRALPAPRGTSPLIDLADARIAWRDADPARTRTAADKAADALEAFDAPRLLGDARRLIGHADAALDDLDGAVAVLTDAQSLYADAGADAARAAVLGQLGDLRRRQGRLSRARALYDLALDAHDRAGHDAGRGATLLRMADILRLQGHLRLADERLAEAERHFRAGEDASGEIGAVLLRTRVLLDRGAVTRARAQLTETAARVDALRSDHPQRLRHSLLDGWCRLLENDSAGAETVFRTLADAERSLPRVLHAEALLGLAQALGAQGEMARGRGYAERALNQHAVHGDSDALPDSRLVLAQLAYLEGTYDQAASQARQAAALFSSGDRFPHEAQADALHARVLLAQGKAREARQRITGALLTAEVAEHALIRFDVRLTDLALADADAPDTSDRQAQLALLRREAASLGLIAIVARIDAQLASRAG